MVKVNRINISQVEGGYSDDSDKRPNGEMALYDDNNGGFDLVIHDGVNSTNLNKVLGKGKFYGHNADSGDGNGYDTIKLIPDIEAYNNGSHQYLIVDPTGPNHIHIRAGGTQDNSNSQLFLGGENSFISVNAGENPPIYVRANNYNWVFGTDGSFNLPVSGNITFGDETVQDTAASGLISEALNTSLVAGSGISLDYDSGSDTLTISSSGLEIDVEQIDDRVSELLVAGTGVYLDYNDTLGILTLNNLHTEINELAQEPQGFVNRTDSVISFNDTNRTFTIAPSGSSYDIYIEGVKVTKTGTETVVIGSGTALNYIHFDTDTHQLHYKTTPFDFDNDVPIAFIHWNADINQSTFFGEERHGIRMDSVTHKWIHNTFGIQYIEGLSIGNYILLGDGSSNSHAQISISNGTLYQEDIVINIADGDNGVEFTQQLDPIAYIPTYYHSGSTGQWVRGTATAYPVKYNGTRAQYNLLSGGTWTTPNVPNNRYFAMWIVATNDMNDPILAIVGQREDSSLGSAENLNTWSDLNLANIPANELKPLYRLIFVTNDTFTNTPKSSLQSILDLRESVSSTINGVTQNDHGLLFGLGDDDHSQYVHINNARTINANHTFTNGLTISSGLLSATSGNFTSSLQLNGTNVSVSGHTHTSSNITNFNSAVSGLLPANLVTGTGVANHVAYWNSSSEVVADSGQLYWDSTNNRLAIGTQTPSAPLEVYGTSTGTASGTGGILKILGSATNALTFGTLNSIPYPCYIQSGGSSLYSLALNPLGGNVGIAINNPTHTLHVVGSGYFNGFLDVDNIRVDGNTISSTNTNGNIVLAPNGTGDVQVDADTLRVGDSNSAATITSNGTGNLTISTNSGTNSGTIVINQGTNGNIAITPNGTGEVDLSKVDIDGGSIDNTAIGATTASTGKFKQLYPTVISNGNVSGSVGTDVSTGQIFDMTLTGGTTLSNPTNAVDGVTVRWRITQDGTGGHSVTLGSEFQIPSSASSPLPWSTAAGATDILAATYHAGRVKWDVVAFVPGY